MATSAASLLDPLKKQQDDLAAQIADPAAPAATPAAPAAPAAPDYTPITQPTDGLLATAVGPSTQPKPPVDPSTYEDDDVVNQMNKITSQDSDYMKLARTSGLQTANKRGLLNSSIAAGASQASALAAAAPLAQQNAQQIAARNLARVQGYYDERKQNAQFVHEDAQQLADIQNKLKMQGIDITAQEATQMRDIQTRLNMQGIDVAAQQELQARQLQQNRQLADLNIAAESERLGRQLTANEEAQQRDLASRESLARLDAQLRESQFVRELSSKETLTREDFSAALERAQLSESGATARANLDAATRVQLQAMDNLNDQQKASLSTYIESNKQYADSIDALYANRDMPAPARDAAMQNFLTIRNANYNLPSVVFGRQLDWGAAALPPQNPSGYSGYAPGAAG